jgi:hypothetical protein
VTRMVTQVIPDLSDRVLQRWVITPADLESRYGCTEGSLSHGELALDQFLFMRPVPACSRHASPLAGFWLCGTGTHPVSASGAGAPLVAREIDGARKLAARCLSAGLGPDAIRPCKSPGTYEGVPNRMSGDNFEFPTSHDTSHDQVAIPDRGTHLRNCPRH